MILFHIINKTSNFLRHIIKIPNQYSNLVLRFYFFRFRCKIPFCHFACHGTKIFYRSGHTLRRPNRQNCRYRHCYNCCNNSNPYILLIFFIQLCLYIFKIRCLHINIIFYARLHQRCQNINIIIKILHVFIIRISVIYTFFQFLNAISQ